VPLVTVPLISSYWKKVCVWEVVLRVGLNLMNQLVQNVILKIAKLVPKLQLVTLAKILILSRKIRPVKKIVKKDNSKKKGNVSVALTDVLNAFLRVTAQYATLIQQHNICKMVFAN
jgi:hypothetical protein